MYGDSTSPLGPHSDQSDAARFLPREAAASDVHLPEAYGRLHVTLMVRDPRWLFAYWERTWPGPPFYLALYETNASGDRRHLLSRQSLSGNGSAYLPVPRGDRHYVAQLEEAEGRLLATSNVVYTPPEGPSSIEDRLWLTLPALHRLAYGGWGEGSSPGLFGGQQAPSLFGEYSSPLHWR